METVLTISFFLLPYLLGSIASAIIVCKALHGVDIRDLGSNNAGSTNVFRQLGFKAGAITQLIDILKGAVAAALPYIIAWTFPEESHLLSETSMELQSIVCGMLAVLGHIYPVFFGFRGGKGINTLLGMMLVTNWLACLVCVLAWVLILYTTRFVAIASMGGVLAYPLFLLAQSGISGVAPNWLLVFAGFGMFLLVVFTHRTNIARLMKGTEGKNPWFEGRVQ